MDGKTTFRPKWVKDENPLLRYAEENARNGGPLLWKLPSYFSFYDRVLRHLRQDTSRKITMLEIGINTGGREVYMIMPGNYSSTRVETEKKKNIAMYFQNLFL